jgi:methyl-accepting chemotaxis protein
MFHRIARASVFLKIQAVALIPSLLIVAFMSRLDHVTKKEAVLTEKRAALQAVVDLGLGIMQSNYQEFKDGKISEEEAKRRSLQSISAIRYGADHSDYFWINDHQPKMIWHPKAEMVGKDLQDYKDPNGKKLFVEFVKVVNLNQRGFVDYIWFSKQDKNVLAPKLSFVANFEPWGWIIGSGIYLDDVDALLWQSLLKDLAIGGCLFIAILVGVTLFVRWSLSSPLLAMVKRLRSRVDSLNASSDQISSTAHNIASGVDDQRRDLGAAHEIMDQVNEMAAANEDRASQARKKTSEFVSISEEGMGTIHDMRTSFTSIQNGKDGLMKTIQKSQKDQERIAQMVEEIGSKTKVINEIVFQTKLLSFNASVEAARAGEHGKGFAVVAEEVGKLAAMTQLAAQEITQIVQDNRGAVATIVSDTNRAISEVTSTLEKNITTAGTHVEQCSNLFSRISDEAKSLDTDTESIRSFSQRQKEGLNHMSDAFASLKESVQRNALLGQQAEQTANLLEAENKGLDQNIGSFMSFIFGANDQCQKGEGLAILQWSNRYVLGVEQMDEEHQKIVAIVNILITLINEGRNGELEKHLDSLLDTAVKHFASEERYMESIRYPDYASHKKIHEALLKQLGDHRKKFGTPEFDNARFIRFVQNWLLSHILGVDSRYAKFQAEGRHSKAA